MIKIQNIKTGEIMDFKSVKEWESYILEITGKDKINKGHLYNVINGKSKTCYGFKLADDEIPIPQKPKKDLKNWKEIQIKNGKDIKEFVEAFLMDEYDFIAPNIDFDVKSKARTWGFFTWNVKDVKPVGVYLNPNAIEHSQAQAKGTLIHEALHLKLFMEKKGFADGQKDFETELKKLNEKYPEFNIGSNHKFEIVAPGGFKTFINKIRRKAGLENI